jgi:hypothetical protein
MSNGTDYYEQIFDEDLEPFVTTEEAEYDAYDEADDLYHRAVDAAVQEGKTVAQILAERKSGRIV